MRGERATPQTAGTVRVLLDLDVGSDPMTGMLEVGGGQPERFVGWTGLTVAIDRLVDEWAPKGDTSWVQR